MNVTAASISLMGHTARRSVHLKNMLMLPHCHARIAILDAWVWVALDHLLYWMMENTMEAVKSAIYIRRMLTQVSLILFYHHLLTNTKKLCQNPF